MKTTLKTLLWISFLLPLLGGCLTQFSIPENATHDANFIGTWKGQHLDKKTGQLRKWLQTRKGDGTYSIQMDYFDKKGKLLGKTSQSGYWWIEKGLFYEISSKNMKTPESYLYRFMGKDKVKFISAKENSSYSFVDTRVKR